MKLRKYPSLLRYAMIISAALLIGACSDSFIFDDEGDCDPNYRVRLHYDWNLKFTDAFAAEVDYVMLNVIDESGKIVYTHTESGSALAQDGYEIVLDDKVSPGTYRLQAWCGSGASDNASFAVHNGDNLSDLRCTLLADANRADIVGADGKEIRRRLGNLYHGLTAPLVFPSDEGTHTFDVPLIKDTNSVKVVFQQLTGAPIDGNDFEFTITSANALMDYDNSILPSNAVSYHPWSVRNGWADVDSEYPSVSGVLNAARAEFTIGRLMYGEDVRLTVTRKSDNKMIFSMPIIDLALMIRSEVFWDMDPQEFLDRQDDYSYIFFLDEGLRWASIQVNILSWHVVINNTEL